MRTGSNFCRPPQKHENLIQGPLCLSKPAGSCVREGLALAWLTRTIKNLHRWLTRACCFERLKEIPWSFSLIPWRYPSLHTKGYIVLSTQCGAIKIRMITGICHWKYVFIHVSILLTHSRNSYVNYLYCMEKLSKIMILWVNKLKPKKQGKFTKVA